jgi:hypothetical protein
MKFLTLTQISVLIKAKYGMLLKLIHLVVYPSNMHYRS